jgi:hypothetical protein
MVGDDHPVTAPLYAIGRILPRISIEGEDYFAKRYAEASAGGK